MAKSDIIESNNLGSFYKYINKRMNHRNSISAITNKDGNLFVSNSDKADFIQYFSSVSTLLCLPGVLFVVQSIN